jgi:glycerol-3-phosphate dehydrogenase
LNEITDIFIIGGGINGCGVAADAAGRGLSVVLCEQNDLASGTSSASTKLIHGGLRYLEYYEFSLVHKALKEREVLLQKAPHIIKPLKFLLPHDRGVRPPWLIRLGLFLYDHIGGRKILESTKTVDLTTPNYAGILQDSYIKAFEYSDCWVDDARLVVLNAMAARDHGAEIYTRHKCTKAVRIDNVWNITVKNTRNGEERLFRAKVLINAAGPWVADVIKNTLHQDDHHLLRLVKGSHIIVHKLFDHDKAYIFQGAGGRIVFAIPYEDQFTLIGTTDVDYQGALSDVTISKDEIAYLCKVVDEYFKRPVKPEDVVSHYSGVRPLFNDGASDAKEATRDFVLKLDKGEGGNEAPLLNIIGGKITTYRVLAEQVLAKIEPFLTPMKDVWTTKSKLPGGDFDFQDYQQTQSKLQNDFPFLMPSQVKRLMRSYGLCAWKILGNSKNVNDLGIYFGADLYEREVAYLIEYEWAETAEDILRRRSKLGLHLDAKQIDQLTVWLNKDK